MDILALPQRTAAGWPMQVGKLRAALETFLEKEREQLALWLVVGLAVGISAWLVLADKSLWIAFLCLTTGGAIMVAAFGTGRLGRACAAFLAATILGLVLIWARSEMVAAPRVERPTITQFTASVERVEFLAARESIRLTLAPTDPALPARVRVSMPDDDPPHGLGEGATVRLRARLTSPMPMALPGSHDYARDAWFRGIGGLGRALGSVEVLQPAPTGGLGQFRERLDRHIRESLPGAEGAIATALATGDQGAMPEEDAEAMRRSGLAHLLSVSGLHIAAVVGAAFVLTIRLLALSERLALRVNLVLVGAGAGALAGIGYTLLTGAQVPTVRSCIAAILVLVGVALGREAISLRLIAVGALLVLLFRPEALAGASFQFSFAAVTAIVALQSTPWVRRHFSPREEGLPRRFGRSLGSLLLTGLAVEFALMPFALYHFHRAGLYGVFANLVAIPLTTFVVMPLQAAALLFDVIWLGAPFWTMTGWSLSFLLDLAHWVAGAKGAIAILPAMPRWAFGLMAGGFLWLCLWTSRARLLGLVPLAIGALVAAAAPRPDLLVTGDGRHVAIVGEDGRPALLRERAGDFIRDMLAESSGYDGDALPMEALADGRCSADACIADVEADGRTLGLLAIRSTQRLDWGELTQACSQADIVIAERRLPRGCTPRWLKLDRTTLERSGGVTIRLGDPPQVRSVAEQVGGCPGLRRRGPHPSSGRLPHCQFASRWIDEVKPPSSREAEDRLGDHPTRFDHGVERRLEIVDTDHR
ncbi:ComEC/Rec2 family competence protein [Sphingomonas sp. GCM10030256]|uniref:ComEC/Rec2 family competence protein n=1 Tax=Sphingomonas sp. GCM10030256 TaxID=3273427 RepID=UPI00361AB593